MANSRTATVLYIDTTATFSENLRICKIKYIGSASGTAAITDNAKPVWEESGTANVSDEVSIYTSSGITVTVTNGAKVYIYLEK